MATLRKMIKIPATLHPQTEEIAQLRQDKDATAMLVTLYKELIQTQEKLEESEAALQAALQQKEAGQTSQPPPEIINLEEAPQTTAPPSQQTQQASPSTSAPTTE